MEVPWPILSPSATVSPSAPVSVAARNAFAVTDSGITSGVAQGGSTVVLDSCESCRFDPTTVEEDPPDKEYCGAKPVAAPARIAKKAMGNLIVERYTLIVPTTVL